jgi:hypothetical protein
MFTETQIKLAAAASALAHPVKVAILECLTADKTGTRTAFLKK